jgi:hypothetical protein
MRFRQAIERQARLTTPGKALCHLLPALTGLPSNEQSPLSARQDQVNASRELAVVFACHKEGGASVCFVSSPKDNPFLEDI